VDIPLGAKHGCGPASRSAGLVLMALIAFSVLSHSIVSILFGTSRDIEERYQEIELNSTREMLDSIFERQPELIVRFSNRDVVYYEQVGLRKSLTGEVIGQYKDEGVYVETLADLPYIYGAVLVVIDGNSGTILMKTRLGEERYVHTVFGKFPFHGGFKGIPREVQGQLLGSDQGIGQIIRK